MSTDTLPKDVSVQEFSDALTPQKVLQLQIIVAALVMGVVMFLAVALFIQFPGDREQILYPDSTAILAAIPVIFVLALLASSFFPRLANVTPTSQIQGVSITPVERAYANVQVRNILRFVPLEGAALFGCVFFFIGQGYICLLATAPMFIVALLKFPTRQRIINEFIVHVKKDPRLLHTAI